MIRQATEKDVTIIEDILLEAVNWMTVKGINNLWNEFNIKWDELSKNYKITDFYIAYENEIPTACMALTEVDYKYWPQYEKGEALFIHKLAVKRKYAAKGIADKLISFAKGMATKYDIDKVCLECNKNRIKLKMLYEKNGFICVGEMSCDEDYMVSLYKYSVK